MFALAVLSGCSAGGAAATNASAIPLTAASLGPLSGTYTGQITDTLAGGPYAPRVGDISIALQQTDAIAFAFQGNYNQGFPIGIHPPQDLSIVPPIAISGSGSGTLSGTALTLSFTAGTCAYTMTGTLSGIQFTGSYSSPACGDSGTISATRG